MTRPVTAALTFLALAILMISYRAARLRPGSEAPSMATENTTGAVVVLPAVSVGWSNLMIRGAQVRPVTARIPSGLSDVEFAPLPETNVNMAVVGARAKELMAEAALEGVGVDPDAEQYWLAAINDSNLSAAERQALILGLSEAGLMDRNHVSADDLPLIASRIALIEEVAPGAIDAANAAAFQETYRDLLNLFATVTGPEADPSREVDPGSGE